MDISQVCAYVKLSKATIYRLVGQGKFPKQIHLTPGTVYWIKSHIDEWRRIKEEGDVSHKVKRNTNDK